MSSRHSLEAERQAILSRMQASRDEYRKVLKEGAEVHLHDGHLQVEPLHGIAGHHGMVSHYAQPHNPALELAGSAAAWARQHPFLCAAAVAAVVAVGPRRIMRSARGAVSGGAALTALTLRNTKNIDTLTRLISSVAGYMQRNRTRYPP